MVNGGIHTSYIYFYIFFVNLQAVHLSFFPSRPVKVESIYGQDDRQEAVSSLSTTVYKRPTTNLTHNTTHPYDAQKRNHRSIPIPLSSFGIRTSKQLNNNNNASHTASNQSINQSINDWSLL